MRIAFAVLVAFLLSAQTNAKELFAARCVSALTKKDWKWSVEETRRGVLVRYSDPAKKFSTEVTGADATGLRTKITGLRLSEADIELLRSREVKMSDGTILLRPFDGADYYFTMPSGASLMIDNPQFDLERQASLPETARLREVLDLLDQLTRIAKKENRANQSVEPTPGSVTSRAPSTPPK